MLGLEFCEAGKSGCIVNILQGNTFAEIKGTARRSRGIICALIRGGRRGGKTVSVLGYCQKGK